jgi:hypothetical protein
LRPGLAPQGTQVVETPIKEVEDQQPRALRRAASRVPGMLATLAASAAIGAAVISAYALTDFKIFAERSPPQEVASVPIPDPAISAMLKDVHLSQQQNAAVLQQNTAILQQNAAALERLALGSNAQQADLHKISDQLSSLVVRNEALQKAATPPPITTSAIPQPKPRSPLVRAQHKDSSRSSKPTGPVSIGGAPLRPSLTAGGG